jgi:hypothetical protein
LKKEDARRIVRQAIAGIKCEAELLGEEKQANDGKRLVRMLEEKTDHDLDTLYSCCIYMYTLETFLYHLTNKTLRSNDMSKIKTLGPFAFLLNNALWRYRSAGHFVLYRGVQLEPEMIEMYKSSVDQVRSWPAFTSTSKNRDLAKHFGNTLFQIKVIPRPFVPSLCTDITHFSEFQNEEEVLLPTAVSFMVNSVKLLSNGKHEVSLTI